MRQSDTPDFCPKCRSQIMPAMIRCRACGWRRDGTEEDMAALDETPVSAAAPGAGEDGFELTMPPPRPRQRSSDRRAAVRAGKPALPATTEPAPERPESAAAQASPVDGRPDEAPQRSPGGRAPPARRPRYTITVHCPACRCPVTARGRLRGQRVKCPECRGPVLIEPESGPPVGQAPYAAAGVAEPPTRAPDPPRRDPPASWVAAKMMIERQRQAREEAQRAMQRRSRSAARRLNPARLLEFASPRTLTLAASLLIVLGVVVSGIWWSPASWGGGAAASGPRGFVASLSFSGNGAVLAAGRTFGRIELWDAKTNALRGSPSEVRGKYVGLNRDGTRIVAGDERRSALYDIGGGAPLAEESGVRRVVVNQSGSHAIGEATDGRLVVWNLAAGKIDARLQLDRNDVTVTAIGPDGRECAIGTKFGEIIVLDVAAAEVVRELQSGAAVTALAFDGSGERLASAAGDGRLLVWKGDELDREFADSDLVVGVVTRLCWLAGERLLAGGGTQLTLCAPGTEPQRWDAELESIDALAVDPAGGAVAVGSTAQSEIIIYDVEARQERASLDVPDE